MKTELKDVIHLLMGCELLHSYGDMDVSVGRMVGITASEVNPGRTVVITSENFAEWFVEDVKPILHRLSSMTEEEDQKEFPAHNRGEFIDMHWHPEGFHWLLSKGFDLFNLIDSGQAIDAETLK